LGRGLRRELRRELRELGFGRRQEVVEGGVGGLGGREGNGKRLEFSTSTSLNSAIILPCAATISSNSSSLLRFLDTCPKGETVTVGVTYLLKPVQHADELALESQWGTIMFHNGCVGSETRID
jgi:hypothetical protein